MSFSDYSLTPSNNLTIDGQSIAEGTTSPGTINLAIRQLMSDGRELSDQVNAIDLSGYAPLSSPVFTGQPTYTGRGAFLHHNNSANLSGRLFVQAEGAAVPTMANGDILATY
ncbi:hypothetical protein [Pelagerythrobacter marinus]|uniref:hypothetical protein n=1 Tax=Pelagerythrobacter marinus TaxID=538382 RepID=UPI002AC9AC6D|nr:hypothetical protein [Pelagerythrobacter marinus]WPZ05483.1 hypothetical protein T8T98_08560 [Pelagerythrobacter marinus]